MGTLLYSRTLTGLVLVLVVGCAFAAFGKLTAELTELLKWAFLIFAANRTVTNVAESRAPGKTDA